MFHYMAALHRARHKVPNGNENQDALVKALGEAGAW